MTQILSRTAVAFDITSGNLRAKAGDLGEIIAMLAGGVRPDPEALSRLCVSMRALQGFLVEEADQQMMREVVRVALSAPFDEAGALVRAYLPVALSHPCRSQVKYREEIAEGRAQRVSA